MESKVKTILKQIGTEPESRNAGCVVGIPGFDKRFDALLKWFGLGDLDNIADATINIKLNQVVTVTLTFLPEADSAEALPPSTFFLMEKQEDKDDQ